MKSPDHKLSRKKKVRFTWFNILALVFVAYFATQKDFSFQINLSAPDSDTIEQKEVVPEIPIHQEVKKKDEGLLTEKQSKSAKRDKLDINPFAAFASKTPLWDMYAESSEEKRVAFINRFKHVAENEEVRYGIPVSIILANGLLMSAAGTSDEVDAGNAYFRIPCTDDWKGDKGQVGKECMRYYENAWMSFRDHSLYLTTYLFSNDLPNGDYKTWAKALNKKKYVNEDNLDDSLIKIIKEYQLDNWDEVYE